MTRQNDLTEIENIVFLDKPCQILQYNIEQNKNLERNEIPTFSILPSKSLSLSSGEPRGLHYAAKTI